MPRLAQVKTKPARTNTNAAPAQTEQRPEPRAFTKRHATLVTKGIEALRLFAQNPSVDNAAALAKHQAALNWLAAHGSSVLIERTAAPSK